MRILVTGADGLLGSAIVNCMRKYHSVITAKHEDFDVRDLKAMPCFINKALPSLVIHTAAYTNVDACERDRQGAYYVNTIGTRNIALMCQQLDIPMVYISTDFVFDGEQDTPYAEFDTPNPINVYGKTKLAGEQIVRDLLNKFYIVRVAWLYGHGNDMNIVNKVVQAITSGERTLRALSTRIGNPTNVEDVANALVKLIATGQWGTYHMVNQGATSQYDCVRLIVETMQLYDLDTDARLVTVRPIKSLKTTALRPANSSLENVALSYAIGAEAMPWWEYSLEMFVKSMSLFRKEAPNVKDLS